MKPVLPDTLLTSAKTLIARAQALRERSINARARVAELIDRSSRLTARAEEIEQRLEASGRMCPSCSRSLQWIEQGRIGGVAYDYYHWCARGCGLYCYARNARQWVKLA